MKKAEMLIGSTNLVWDHYILEIGTNRTDNVSYKQRRGLNCRVRVGFHGGPGPGPLLVRILKMGGSRWGSRWGSRPGGPGPPTGPPHFENADKEGSRSRTSMETCP